MNRLIIIFALLIISQINGKCQILIGDKAGNTIYSSVVNQIQYIGKYDCQELSARIEGYDEKMNFENCVFEIIYLRFDTSMLEIINKSDEVIFDTILIKNKNEAKGYVQVGNKLLIEGSINKSELELLEKIKVKYECPWIRAPKIYGFSLIVVDDKGAYLSFEISGDKIPKSYKEEILLMDNPKRIYIDQINWVPRSCFETVNSIVLEIE